MTMVNIHLVCGLCGKRFKGKPWRKHSRRDCVCPYCRTRTAAGDWGLSSDPYQRGLDRTCSGQSDPEAVINGLMCGMI